jgi:hypothetical protein
VVTAFAAVPSLGYEARIEQYTEVLRDGRPAHLELSRHRVDRAVGLEKKIQHPATRGMANGPKDIRLAIDGHRHAVNIRKQILTRQILNAHTPPGQIAIRDRGAIACGPDLMNDHDAIEEPGRLM